MNWKSLKENIYFEDGSLRDIYVLETTYKDWQKWADFVNEKYEVVFTDTETGLISDFIDMSTVKQFWDKDESIKRAKIKVDDFQINCHFFTEFEIENDISPNEIKSLANHKALTEYLTEISKLLNKKVKLTLENHENHILLEV